MNLKPIQLVIDTNGEQIDLNYKPIRSHTNYKHIFQVVAPNLATEACDITVSTYNEEIVSETVRTRLAKDSDGNYIKGSDVVDPQKDYYQVVSDYNVWEVEVIGTVVSVLQKVNTTKITMVASFSTPVTDARALNYLGQFGDAGDLPTPTEETEGDYFVCDSLNFTSTTTGIDFKYKEIAIFNGINWYKGRSYRMIQTCPIVYLRVDPSLALVYDEIEEEDAESLILAVSAIDGIVKNVQDRVGSIESDILDTNVDVTSIAQSVIEHILNMSNPHSVTKAQLGLENVDNTSDADKPISNAQAAVNAIKADLVGGLVPADQLPSYVDDVIEVNTYADLPATGESGKIYVVVADETSGGNTSTYRWATSVYVMISNELSASEVKALYESNANTNAYTDTEKSIVAVAQENVIETVKVNGVTESVTSKAVDIDVPTKTSELINDGDGTTNFVTAEQLGDAGYGDMTKAEFNTNGTPGVVDKAVVAEELETNAVNDLPYIGDSSWDTPKNGIPTAIGKDNVVMPDVEGLTFAQIANGDLPSDIEEWDSAYSTVLSNEITFLRATYANDRTRFGSQLGSTISQGNDFILLIKIRGSKSGEIRLQTLQNSILSGESVGIDVDITTNWQTFSIKEASGSSSTNDTSYFGIDGTDFNASGDYIDVADINVIPVPPKNTSLTDAQILKFFSGADYIPKGLHGIKDLVITSNYTNLFDYVEYNANNAYEYLIEVVSGLSYKFSESIGYKLYDKDEIEISSGTSSTVTATDAKYISFNSGIADVEAFMLTLSSYTGDYVEYQAPLTYELDTPMYSNDTRDLQGDAVDTTVVKNLTSWSIAGTKTNTHFFFKMLPISIEIKTPDNDGEKTVNSLIIGETVFTNETRNGLNDDVQNTFAVSSNGSINIRVNKTTYPTSADFEAYLQANDVTFIYELATPLPRTEANDNLLVERGALLVSEYGTYTQGDQYGVKTEFNAKSALDLVKQVQIGVSTDVAQEKKLIEIDNRICGTHAAIQVLELTAARINRITYKPDYDYASQSYLFPQNNTTERMYATLPSPNDWVVGTPIRIQVHITQEDTGQAVMKVDYKLFEAAGATIPATATTYTMDTYVDDSYVSGSMSNALRDGVEIDTSDITTRAFIRLEIYRDDNAYSGDLKVDDVAIFYTAYNCCDCSTVE